MGMSASQMRYCLLSGRKSDVEFQGQQINQQRTTLATETSAYNNQLLNLSVPTPPSSDSYTTTSYSFTNNGQTYEVTGAQFKTTKYYVDSTGNVVNGDTPPNGEKVYNAGTYVISGTSSAYGTKGQSSGTSVFTKITHPGQPAMYEGSTGSLSLAADPSDKANYANDLANISQICSDCNIPMVNNTYPPFYKYTTGGTTYYVMQSDLDKSANTVVYNDDGSVASSSTPNTGVSTYYVNPKATVSNPLKMCGAQVFWSDTGRMDYIVGPDGKQYDLSVKTENDSTAYNDALQEYEYQKGLYNQEIEKINSQICIIQSQDKKLELKLQDLDTQQEAINTEMESVKKVVDKNIEQSFKAFA